MSFAISDIAKNNPFYLLDGVWQNQKDKFFVTSSRGSLSYDEFKNGVQTYIGQFQRWQTSSLALLADNSIEWLMVDFACQILAIPLLPLPLYFTESQIKHSITLAQCDVLLIDKNAPQSENNILSNSSIKSIEQAAGPEHFLAFSLSVNILEQDKKSLPLNTAKVTFTSGTTGQPKGVCLSFEQQWQVAKSIKTQVDTQLSAHLCLLPLSVLLENVAGVYASMLNGTRLLIPTLAELGFTGSSTLNFSVLAQKISFELPNAIITTPEILLALITAAEQGWQVPDTLKFVAVGGARVSALLLERAHVVGLPVFQGYGLSECASVVSLNTPKQSQINSMGAIFQHNDVFIEKGEVMISGNTFLGYAGQPNSWHQKVIATGDMGHINREGFLTITGRKKNIIISSFGRNINPEWLEAEILSSPLFQQAFVFGDEQPFCCAALFVAKSDHLSSDMTDLIDKALEQINRNLPDYAQIKTWFVYQQVISPNTALMTANGRIKRANISQYFSQEIEAAYKKAKKEINTMSQGLMPHQSVPHQASLVEDKKSQLSPTYL